VNAGGISKQILCWLLILLLSAPISSFAQSSGSPTRFSQQELTQVLAPIALFPDSLMAQVLMAATYPVEVAQADRWAKGHRNLKGDQLNAVLDKMKWDLSVKALVPFPQVLALMSVKLDWTQRVGDAFLDQQNEVMDAIQQLRSKAYAQGSLKSCSEQKVVIEEHTIRIEPANPQLIYVPVYNSSVVYGSWPYPEYLPCSLYPAGAIAATGMISFAAGVAVGSAWNAGWGSWNWGAHQINTNINRPANINDNHISVSSLQTAKWEHDAGHRLAVPYRSRDLRNRYGQTGRSDQAARFDFRGFDQNEEYRLDQGTNGYEPDQRRGSGSPDRPATFQDRQTSLQTSDLSRPDQEGFTQARTPNAFEGIEHGNDAQRFSDRGWMSRQSALNRGSGGGASSSSGSGRGARVGGSGIQREFASPEEAVQALMIAIKTNNTKELLVILGAEGRDLVFSGDEVGVRAASERFEKASAEMNQLEKRDPGRVILHVGSEDWPFPVPIMNRGNFWYFNTNEGRDEILSRRIGKNELNAVQVCLAFVDAEVGYASLDRIGDGVLQYAQKFASRAGRKDGLYWPGKEGEEPSPMGSLVARACEEEYRSGRGGGRPIPYHGYYYRILKGQGSGAPEGARDYVVKGKMIGGFALVAYPEQYGVSGIRSFIVNHDGMVYEKDLGKKTSQAARAMRSFDPDKTWKKVE
jgi:hypothetical protein